MPETTRAITSTFYYCMHLPVRGSGNPFLQIKRLPQCHLINEPQLLHVKFSPLTSFTRPLPQPCTKTQAQHNAHSVPATNPTNFSLPVVSSAFNGSQTTLADFQHFFTFAVSARHQLHYNLLTMQISQLSLYSG